MAIFGRRQKPPADLVARLGRDERILSWADTTDGGVVAATQYGLWWPFEDGTRLVRKRRDLKVQVKKHQATVNSVLGWHCPICGEVEFAPGEGRRYSAAICRAATISCIRATTALA